MPTRSWARTCVRRRRPGTCAPSPRLRSCSASYSRLCRKAARAQSTDEEYRVKAAFIFHFAQLVDWPPETRTDAANSLFLCTIGEDPFQGALESTVAGQNGRRSDPSRSSPEAADDMQACQILFLGKAQSKRIPMLLANLHNAPILTVGESRRLSRRRRNDLLCSGRQQCSFRNQPGCSGIRKTQDRVTVVDPGPNRDWREPGEVRA